MSAKDRSWREWTEVDWNEALFEHFFSDSDGSDHPVNRIPVTSDELIKIVSDLGADAHEVQEAFLRVVRTPSHTDYNHRLSLYPIDPKTGWKGSTLPEFFFELAFSCLAASPPNGEIRNNGDFRNRLSMLLGHDQEVANYPLDILPHLWRAFSIWINCRRSTGEPYRRLELPPLDHRVRIGYSINLAFPLRKDMITLTKILFKGGFEGDPPLQAVFELVGKEIERFSPNFTKAYQEFRNAFKNKEKYLERFPFWGAVRAAISSALDEEIEDDSVKRKLKLVLESGGVVLLLSTAPGDVLRNVLSFVETDSNYGEFSCVLCLRNTTSFDFHQATRRILAGRYRDCLTGGGWKVIDVAVEQGLLLFKKTESLSWELTFTRQDEGVFQALVMNFLAADFLNSFPQDRRPHGKSSPLYDGWTEVELFPGEWLNLLSYAHNSPLSKIRCLQSTVSGPRLSLIGGCPIDGGFLGIPAYLPVVRAFLSDTVQVIPIDQEGGEPIRLARVDKDSMDFSFPKNLRNQLQGRYRVVGNFDNRVLVQKEVLFHSEIVVNAYAQPTDSSAWEIEAGGPDVMTYADVPRSAPYPSDGSSRQSGTKAHSFIPSRVSNTIRLLKSPPNTWPRIEACTSTKIYNGWEPNEYMGADHFMEVCGGLAMRRKGIPEAELLDLVRDCLAVHRYNQQWDVVRAWVEGGHFDCLHYKKWRRTEYFPRVPRFVLEASGGTVRGVLFGLATAAFRNRADIELLELGAEREQVASRSDWVVPAPAWRAPSADPFFRVSKTLGLEEAVWTRPLVETLWSLSDVVVARESPPQYYEIWGCWDWDNGWFSRDTKPTEKGVGVIRFQRPDRPPYYQVTIDGEHAWWSISRNWSLLLAQGLIGKTDFALAGVDQVVRVGKGQVYLPLPVGRHLAMTGVTAPGPAGYDNGIYIYQFRDSKERQRFLSAIWGSAEFDKIEMSRWARWILSISRRPILETGMRVVPLPSFIRQGLERFDDVPEFLELSRAKIDPSLLPRVREGLSRFTKSREV